MNEKLVLNYKIIMFGKDTHNPDLLLNLCILIIKLERFSALAVLDLYGSRL
jgi:hypothetical protein